MIIASESTNASTELGLKKVGVMAEIAEAPVRAACVANCCASKRLLCPTWTITGTRPEAAWIKAFAVAFRSSLVSEAPSPVPPLHIDH